MQSGCRWDVDGSANRTSRYDSRPIVAWWWLGAASRTQVVSPVTRPLYPQKDLDQTRGPGRGPRGKFLHSGSEYTYCLPRRDLMLVAKEDPMKHRCMIPVAAMLGLATVVVVAGCENPAKGKEKAEVGKAKTISEMPQDKEAEKIALTPGNSKITWKGSKVTGAHDGGFRSFSGEVSAVAGDPLKARISLTIDVKSLYSDQEKLTGHLKSDDFFSVDKFPEAKFVSSSIAEGGKGVATHTISGNLTMRDVTKGVSFPATLKITEDRVEANAEFVINRRDWGINYDGMADDLIRNEVVLKLEVKASRKK